MAAAFIGPGTISTCAQAGAAFHLELLWALTFAVGGCVVLQEMSARVGLVTRQGVGEALNALKPLWLRRILRWLAVVSLSVGNASLEAGNISGTGIGLRLLLGAPRTLAHRCSFVAGFSVIAMLALGRESSLTRVLGFVVVTMSALFLATATSSGVSPWAVSRALLVPAVPLGSGTLLMAIVGTTICAYNLFLQSSAVAETAERGGHRRDAHSVREQLRWCFADTAGAALLGGVISASIIVTAAELSRRGTSVGADGVEALAHGIEAQFGALAATCFEVGLLAAGLSSSLTAPLATRYALCGLLGWETDTWRGTGAWALVAMGGTLAASLPWLNPLGIILFAQVCNAVLLPLLVVGLMLVAASGDAMGEFRSSRLQIALGMAVVTVTLVLSGHSLARATLSATHQDDTAGGPV